MMKAKKIVKVGCGTVAVILAVLLVWIGRFTYVSRYRITDIDSAISDDGQYTVILQAVGEPDFPFGSTHARIVLKQDGKTVAKHNFDVANDGAILFPDNWSVRWEENGVKVVISGEEQSDAFYTLFYDGAVRSEKPDAQEAAHKETDHAEERTVAPLTDFSALAAENEKGESVFAVSIEDFIDCYNRVYRQTHETGYLHTINTDNWYSYPEHSTCFGYDSVRYRFSEDPKNQTLPEVTLYAPEYDAIHEFRLVFDDHGYRERYRVLFKELCVCMEKTLMPELSDAEAENLFEKLYAQADENFFGDHADFDDPDRPKLNAVYRSGNIGLYGFYGSGNIEICFVPLTESAVHFLRTNGTALPEKEDEVH